MGILIMIRQVRIMCVGLKKRVGLELDQTLRFGILVQLESVLGTSVISKSLSVYVGYMEYIPRGPTGPFLTLLLQLAGLFESYVGLEIGLVVS